MQQTNGNQAGSEVQLTQIHLSITSLMVPVMARRDVRRFSVVPDNDETTNLKAPKFPIFGLHRHN